LLLAVAPPAHNNPRKQYDDTFAPQLPRVNVPVPEFVGPHLLNAACHKHCFI